MKPVITKISLFLILVLFQVCFHTISVFADIPPDWYVLNTGTNHTILISEDANPTLNGISLDSGDFMGVFYDSLGYLACGGYVMWTNSTTAIAAWGEDNGNDGFMSGEKFKWKVWDSSIGEEYKAIASFNGEDFSNTDSYGANGMSGVIALDAYPEQTINLHEGWNYYTSVIDPIVPEWYNIFEDIDSDIIINQDFEDKVYWPLQTKETNEISWAESYKIKVNKDVSFSLWGRQINPEDTTFIIPPEPHHISYLRNSTASIGSVFDELIDDVRILKSEDGSLYWPDMNQYYISNFYPGKAYQILTSNTIFLSQPKNDTTLTIDEEINNTHNLFYSLDLITGNNMSLGIPSSAWQVSPSVGDEIGVFTNSGLLVGSSIYDGNNIGLIIWGNDETTDNEDGIDPGSSFILKLRDSETGFEDIIKVKSWIEGDSIYQKDKISIIEEIEVEEEEEERSTNLIIQQNNFTNFHQIIISVREQTNVSVNIFDYSGRVIRNIISDNLTTGKYYYDVDLSDLSSGIYFFKMETDKSYHKIVKKKQIIRPGS